MNDRETINYINKIFQRIDRTEKKLDIFEKNINITNDRIILNSPIYFTNILSPITDQAVANIGSEKNFIKNLYIEGQIIYPDKLQLGINNDFVIDKLGKIGLHKSQQLDSLSLQNLPSFSIENVKVDSETNLVFTIDNDYISNYVTIGDTIKCEECYYNVVEIHPKDNSIKLHPLSADAQHFLNINKEQNIRIEIYPSILGIYNHNGTNYLKINAFGDLFYKSSNRKAEINFGGAVNFEKEVNFDDDIQTNNLYAKEITAVNLNTQKINNVEIPSEGMLVTDNSEQILLNKKFGNDVNLTNNRIIDVRDPIDEKDAVNKRYVDQYLSGLKINKSVKALSVKNINGSYNKDSEELTVELDDQELTNIFDNVRMCQGDAVLINNQYNKVENGIYIFNGNNVFRRRNDFSKEQSIDKLKSYYVYVESGEIHSKKSFVFNYIENFVWNRSDIFFNIFSQNSDIHLGKGLKKINGEISLNLDEKIFYLTENNKLTIDRINSTKIDNAYFNINAGNGIKTNSTKIKLLDNLDFELNINKSQFYFGKNGELKLFESDNDINNLVSNINFLNVPADTNINGKLGSTDNIEIIEEMFPPSELKVSIRESDDVTNRETDVYYMIKCIDKNNNETNTRQSRKISISKKCKSVYSQINWTNVQDILSYKIYRCIDDLCEQLMISNETNELVDILVPHNFSKLDWKKCAYPDDKNTTRKVISRISAKENSFLQNTRLGKRKNLELLVCYYQIILISMINQDLLILLVLMD